MYRRAGRGRLVLLVFVALSLLIISLDFRRDQSTVLEGVRDISAEVVAPIQRGVSAIARPIGNFFSSIGDLTSLRNENERLKAEVEELRAQAQHVDALADQNARLNAMVGLEESWAVMERVGARVFGSGPSNYKWAVFIDKGSSDGIREDMAVVSTEGLVGKVREVQDNVSTVLLLIDPVAGAGARVRSERGPTGVVQGNGSDQSLSLDLIGSREEVAVGDEVTTSGYDGGIFPPDIPIGTVSEVGGDSSELQQNILIDPYVDFTSLAEVWVLLESGPRLDTSRGKKQK